MKRGQETVESGKVLSRQYPEIRSQVRPLRRACVSDVCLCGWSAGWAPGGGCVVCEISGDPPPLDAHRGGMCIMAACTRSYHIGVCPEHRVGGR